MPKYYGVWNNFGEYWWPINNLSYWHNEITTVSWNITKMINGIPIWDDPDNISKLFHINSTWKIKEFTPQDALLARCGKNG